MKTSSRQVYLSTPFDEDDRQAGVGSAISSWTPDGMYWIYGSSRATLTTSPFLDMHDVLVHSASGPDGEVVSLGPVSKRATSALLPSSRSSIETVKGQWGSSAAGWVTLFGFDREGGRSSTLRYRTADDYQAARDELEALSSYESGWDGDRSIAMSSTTRAWGKSILRYAEPLIPRPTLTLNENGTITFEWDSRFAYAYLEIGDTRHAMLIQRTGEPDLLINGENTSMRDLVSQVAGALRTDPLSSFALTGPRYSSMELAFGE